MVKPLLLIVVIVSLASIAASREADADDRMLANSALNALHNLAIASQKLVNATKDSDNIGCASASETIEQSAHEALDSMHSMSATPHDAINSTSELLRFDHLASSNSCSLNEATSELPLIAGQAIMSLRWDYAIGDKDWYMAAPNGSIQVDNPLRYAQSLKEENYSWVDTRPKGMLIMVEENWKSEMASSDVDDPSIENSGINLRDVEVDYRHKSGDDNSKLYFYQFKEDAIGDAKAAAEQEAAERSWGQKLFSLPYIIAEHESGFKLIYGMCKKNDNNYCIRTSVYDWSDNRRDRYHWFSNLHACEDAESGISFHHPPNLKASADSIFTSDCVPASQWTGHPPAGYQLEIALDAPGSGSDQTSYAYVRRGETNTPITFQSLTQCSGYIMAVYDKFEKDFQVNDDGTFLNDKSKSISVTVNCVRTY